jgi:hypothetical protein
MMSGAAKPRIPAECGTCGLLFPSAFAAGRGNVHIENCVQTCPRCGAGASVMSGSFSAIGNELIIMRVSDSSKNMLGRLIKTLEAAEKGDISKEETIKEVKELSPELATVLKGAKNKKYWQLLLGALIAALANCQSQINVNANYTHETKISKNIDIKLDVNELLKQIMESQKK